MHTEEETAERTQQQEAAPEGLREPALYDAVEINLGQWVKGEVIATGGDRLMVQVPIGGSQSTACVTVSMRGYGASWRYLERGAGELARLRGIEAAALRVVAYFGTAPVAGLGEGGLNSVVVGLRGLMLIEALTAAVSR